MKSGKTQYAGSARRWTITMRLNGLNKRLSLFFILVWVTFVLYPQPTALGKSIYRLFDPPVAPGSIGVMLEALPSQVEPPEIEEYILTAVPYSYDWQVYNLPWYFPTVEEALLKGTGDCKSRFIVLASVLEALGIPYELYLSPTHIWINYAGKRETGLENRDAALLYAEEGKFLVKLPRVELQASLDMFWEAFWVHMPETRKTTLLSGLLVGSLLFFMPEKRNSPPYK